MEPRVCGEDGYADWSLHLTDLGLCSCDGCGGHLVEHVCQACGCEHGTTGPTRHDSKRRPAWIPVYARGRCAHADAVREEERREHERQERRRRAAGE